MVEVTTTVVTSLTATKRAVAACRPMAAPSRVVTGSPTAGSGWSPTANRTPASPRQTSPTLRKSVVVRPVHFPAARLSTRPPSAAPAMKPTRASTGPSTGRSSAPTTAMPRMTTLPVMLPVKTRSRPR